MIKVNCGKGPAVLQGPKSLGAEEQRKAKSFYRVRKNQDKPFPFSMYKHKQVREELERLCHGKCAYCEGLYAPVAPADIEHYRPKGAVVVNGKLRKPGYYWLAATWSNLLPSCIDCNRARTQDFPDSDPHVAGKANKFPIAKEAKRAKRPSEEVHEERLLLHPCLDDPEQHLEFKDKGEVYPRVDRAGVPSRMAVTSIEVYGLNRKRLVDARASVQVRVEALTVNVERQMLLFNRYPGDPDIEANLVSMLDELKAYTLANQTYAGMCRETVKRRTENLGIPLPPFGS
jgi:uncharacterized protein (TIGR02646 family)